MKINLSLLAGTFLIAAFATVALAVDASPHQGAKSCCSVSNPQVPADEAAQSCHPVPADAKAAMSCHAKVESSVTGMACHAGAKAAHPEATNQPPPAPSCH